MHHGRHLPRFQRSVCALILAYDSSLQILLAPVYLALYVLAPTACHSLVGYVYEEAVRLYSAALDQMHSDRLSAPAPPRASCYWHLRVGGTAPDALHI